MISDLDMLQDYEKDSRAASVLYALLQTDIVDPQLRALYGSLVSEAEKSHAKFFNMMEIKSARTSTV